MSDSLYKPSDIFEGICCSAGFAVWCCQGQCHLLKYCTPCLLLLWLICSIFVNRSLPYYSKYTQLLNNTELSSKTVFLWRHYKSGSHYNKRLVSSCNFVHGFLQVKVLYFSHKLAPVSVSPFVVTWPPVGRIGTNARLVHIVGRVSRVDQAWSRPRE